MTSIRLSRRRWVCVHTRPYLSSLIHWVVIYFLKHVAIPISVDPCFLGTRVAAYGKAIQLQQHILSIQNSMGHCYNIELDRDVLPSYESYTRGEAAISFFNSVSKFWREAVCDWNRTRDDVTLSYNMGFVGVREGSSDGHLGHVIKIRGTCLQSRQDVGFVSNCQILPVVLLR